MVRQVATFLICSLLCWSLAACAGGGATRPVEPTSISHAAPDKPASEMTAIPTASELPDSIAETRIRPLDDRIMRALDEKKFGAVVMDLDVRSNQGFCEQTKITVVRQRDGASRQINGPGRIALFGQGTWGAVDALSADEWIVQSIYCKRGKVHTHLRGPYARFRVNAGEFANVGTLKLDYKVEGFFQKTGMLHKSVGPLSPEAVKHLNEYYRSSMPRAVERPMTIVGAAETEIKGGIGY